MLAATAKFNAHRTQDRRVEQECCLLTLTGPNMAEPLRLVSDVQALTSRGNVYNPFPFNFVFPPEDETMGPARIVVQNVSKQLGDIVKNAKGPIEATMELVLRSDPDYPVRSVPRLKMSSAQVDNLQATFQLNRRIYADSAWPGTKADPSLTPGQHE